jgi:hypothetical protein
MDGLGAKRIHGPRIKSRRRMPTFVGGGDREEVAGVGALLLSDTE